MPECFKVVCTMQGAIQVLCFNDIDDTVDGKILKFADDTKIYNKVDSGIPLIR